MAPPKSDIWRQFTKTSKTEAKCKYCLKILKTSGNTSNLKAHLKIHKIRDEVDRSPPKASQRNTETAEVGPAAKTSRLETTEKNLAVTSQKTLSPSTSMEITTTEMSPARAGTSASPFQVQPSIKKSFDHIKQFGGKSFNELIINFYQNGY